MLRSKGLAIYNSLNWVSFNCALVFPNVTVGNGRKLKGGLEVLLLK